MEFNFIQNSNILSQINKFQAQILDILKSQEQQLEIENIYYESFTNQAFSTKKQLVKKYLQYNDKQTQQKQAEQFNNNQISAQQKLESNATLAILSAQDLIKLQQEQTNLEELKKQKQQELLKPKLQPQSQPQQEQEKKKKVPLPPSRWALEQKQKRLQQQQEYEYQQQLLEQKKQSVPKSNMQKQNVIYGIGGNKKNQTSNQMQQAMGVPSSQSKRSNSLRQGHNSSQNSQQLSQSKLQRNTSQTSFQSKQQDAKKSQHSQQTNKYPQKLTEIEEIDLKLQENLKKQEEILLLKNNLNNPNFNSQYKQQLLDQINQENTQKTNINNNFNNNYEKKPNPFEPQNQHLNQNKKDNDNKQFNFFYNHLQPDQNNLINNINNQEKQKQELENNKELIDIFYQSKKKSLQLKNQFQQNAKYFKEKEAKSKSRFIQKMYSHITQKKIVFQRIESEKREQNNKYNVQEQENDENEENEHNSYDFYYLFPLKQNKNNPKISIQLQKSQLISSSLYECEEDLIKQFQMVSKYIQYFEKSFQNLQIASQLEKIQEIYENESIQLTNQAPLNFNKILQILLQKEKISITDLFRIWYFNNIYQQKMENFTNKIKQMPKELKEFDAKSNQFLSFLQAQKKQQEQNSNQNPNKLLQKFQEQNSLDTTQNNQKLTVQQINLNFNQTADKQFQITLKLNPKLIQSYQQEQEKLNNNFNKISFNSQFLKILTNFALKYFNKELNQVISGGDEILMENFKEVMKKILSIYSIIQYKGNLIPSIFFADNVEEYLQNTLKNDI